MRASKARTIKQAGASIDIGTLGDSEMPSMLHVERHDDDHILIGGITSSRLNRVALTQRMVDDTNAARAGDLKAPHLVIATNGHVIAKYHSNAVFRDLMQQADIVDVDGMPLVFATRLLCRRPLQERVATTDFIHDACAAAAKQGIRFYFLGGQPGIVEKAAENLKAKFPGLNIVGMRHGYFTPQDEYHICRDIVDTGADILWLGLGSPRQESFAVRHRNDLSGLAWIRTCGGMFDFCADSQPRAPQWMQDSGLEWLFRTLQEPRRLGWRYLLTNPIAAYHIATKTRDRP